MIAARHSPPPARRDRYTGPVLLLAALPATWLAFRLVAAVTCDGDDCYGDNVGAPLVVGAFVFGAMAVVGLMRMYAATEPSQRPRFLIRTGWAGVLAAAPLAAVAVAIIVDRFCPSGGGCAGDYLVMAFVALFAGGVLLLVVVSCSVGAIVQGRRLLRQREQSRHPSHSGPGR